jgi:hypothetical protein
MFENFMTGIIKFVFYATCIFFVFLGFGKVERMHSDFVITNSGFNQLVYQGNNIDGGGYHFVEYHLDIDTTAKYLANWESEKQHLIDSGFVIIDENLAKGYLTYESAP